MAQLRSKVGLNQIFLAKTRPNNKDSVFVIQLQHKQSSKHAANIIGVKKEVVYK
jgi:hypothetical protein